MNRHFHHTALANTDDILAMQARHQLCHQIPDREGAELAPLPPDPTILIRASAVHRFTGIQTQTHARWRHEGVGPKFVRLGRRVFYRAGDLRDWINSQVRQNTIRK